jgi:hypothetical protein
MALPGFAAADATPLTRDALDHLLTWHEGDLASLRGRTVRLRLHLRNAVAYALVLT